MVATIEQITKAHTDEVISNVAQPSWRFERKFFIFPKNIGFAYALLRQSCRPDGEYPEGRVNSLYFDTLDLDQYVKSASGEYKKDKVRIRWYNEISDYQEMVPIFLELKSRQGFASNKQRQRSMISAQRLNPTHLSAGIVSKTTIVHTLASFGYFTESPLRPVIMISYWRYRFNEILTGTRVSLDYNIRSAVMTPDLSHGEGKMWLRGGIIEIKGPSMELPVTLRRMRVLDTDWSRFSKYSYCLESHLSDPGSVARFWPSGKMIEP